MSNVSPVAKKIIGNVEKVILGKRQEMLLALVSYFCEGHILLEDVPGVAKTMLARALARSVDCSFKRVQCTPDLLPIGHHGRLDLQPEADRVRLPSRADFRPDRPRRRDQPRHAADASRLAGSHGRRSGDGRRRRPIRWSRRFSSSPPKTRSTTKARFRCRRRSWTASWCGSASGYPSIEEEARMLDRLQHGHPIDSLEPVVTADGHHRLPAGRPRGLRRREGRNDISSRSCMPRGSTMTFRSAAVPGRRLALYRTSQAVAAIRGQ